MVDFDFVSGKGIDVLPNPSEGFGGGGIFGDGSFFRVGVDKDAIADKAEVFVIGFVIGAG